MEDVKLKDSSKKLVSLEDGLKESIKLTQLHAGFFGVSGKEIRKKSMEIIIESIKSAKNEDEILSAFKVINNQKFMHEAAGFRLKYYAYIIPKQSAEDTNYSEAVVLDKNSKTSHIMHLIGEYCAAKQNFLAYLDTNINATTEYRKLDVIRNKLNAHLIENYEGAGVTTTEYCDSFLKRKPAGGKTDLETSGESSYGQKF